MSTRTKSILEQIVETDHVKRMVLETGVPVRDSGVPQDPGVAFGKGVITGIVHRAFCAGARFTRSLGAEPTDAELSDAAMEYTRQDVW